MPRPRSAHTHRSRVHRRYHFGVPALVYIGVTLLIAVGAFNAQNNLLFWSFGLSLGVLIVSGVVSGAILTGVDVQREMIGEAWAGQPVRMRYRVTNRNRFVPLFALRLQDVLLPNNPQRAGAMHTPRAFVHHVGPGETVTVIASALATRRGAIELSGVRIESSFPFGLIRKSVQFDQLAHTIIRPDPIGGDRLSIRPSPGIGTEVRSRRAGTGDDFHSLREFRVGDTVRDIAWRVSARRGRLMVKQSVASSPARLDILLELARTPARSVQDERTISAAAGVALSALKTGIAVGLSEPGGVVHVPLGVGAAHVGQLLDALSLIDTAAPPPLHTDHPARGLRSEATPGVTRLRVHDGAADVAADDPDTTPATTGLAGGRA